MDQIRRTIVVSLLLVGFVLAPFMEQTGRALDFPTKPITMLCGFGAGGITDLTSRALAEAARKYFGQPVIVENVTGGGGSVALGRICEKKPDGYFLAPDGPKMRLTSLLTNLPFDVSKDFTQVIQVWGNPFGILVRSDSPFKTLKELIEYAKANPGKLKHMSAGIGTGPFIIMTELEGATGTKFIHIPGKSDQEASTSLLGGHVDMLAGAMGSCTPLVQAGKLRLLATLGEERIKTFSDVPTVKETGYNIVYVAPLGMVGPKGMPGEIVKALHDGFKKAMEDPIFVSHCDRFGVPILYKDTEAYRKYWADQIVYWENFYTKFIKKK